MRLVFFGRGLYNNRMKIIFTSPYDALWSKDISALAARLDAEDVSIGLLLRKEIASKSFMGRKLNAALDGGELMRADLTSLLIAHKVFDNPLRAVLVGYPRNIIQAESLAKQIINSHYKNDRHGLTACVAVTGSKASVIAKFEAQFRCSDPRHPRIETQALHPDCEVCGKPLVRSYDLNNKNLTDIIDAYFREDGGLASAQTLSKLLAVDLISYTSCQQLAGEIEKRYAGD